MALEEVLPELQGGEATYRGQISPGVHVFAAERAMSRVRSYQTASMSPIGGRGQPLEVVLMAHVHEDAAGKVARIEGFNGAAGERLAEKLRAELAARGLVPPGAAFRASQPLRECPHALKPLPRER